MHVWTAHTRRKRAGLPSRVLNIDPRAPGSSEYIRVSGAPGLMRELFRHVRRGWTLNVHTNGHNRKSWLISLACGMAAQLGPGAALTLHSGLAPGYIRRGRNRRRLALRLICMLYTRVVAVNAEIAAAVASLGVPEDRVTIAPAFLPVEAPQVEAPREIESWMARHSPVIASAMFFRPEYGFELLAEAAGILRETHPAIGCLVMGCGEDRERARALIERRGLEDTILLAGDLAHELCLALMKRSSAFVRPSLKDGDSISVREAVSLGIPVVASRVGTRPEGVLLFEPGDVQGLVEKLNGVIPKQCISE